MGTSIALPGLGLVIAGPIAAALLGVGADAVAVAVAGAGAVAVAVAVAGSAEGSLVDALLAGTLLKSRSRNTKKASSRAAPRWDCVGSAMTTHRGLRRSETPTKQRSFAEAEDGAVAAFVSGIGPTWHLCAVRCRCSGPIKHWACYRAQRGLRNSSSRDTPCSLATPVRRARRQAL